MQPVLLTYKLVFDQCHSNKVNLYETIVITACKMIQASVSYINNCTSIYIRPKNLSLQKKATATNVLWYYIRSNPDLKSNPNLLRRLFTMQCLWLLT